MFNKKDACKSRILPKVQYTNMRKEFPNMGAGCFKAWLSFDRKWSGRLVYVSIKHHQLCFDFRLNWLADMVHPNG